MMGWAQMGPTRLHRSLRVSLHTAPGGTQSPKKCVCVEFCHLLDVGLRKAHMNPKSSHPPF